VLLRIYLYLDDGAVDYNINQNSLSNNGAYLGKNVFINGSTVSSSVTYSSDIISFVGYDRSLGKTVFFHSLGPDIFVGYYNGSDLNTCTSRDELELFFIYLFCFVVDRALLLKLD
jgi:hypothetical protein